MAAFARNPIGGNLQVLTDFPSGTAGMQFHHSGFGCAFVHNGSRWRTQDGGAGVYPAGVGVDALTAVTLVDGTLELLDVSVHERATGVVSAVVGADALVRWSGEIDGFAGLLPHSTYCGSGEPGLLTANPSPELSLMRLGVAQSATRLLVDIDQPVL